MAANKSAHKKKGAPRYPPPPVKTTVCGDIKNRDEVRIAYLVRGAKDPAFTPWPFMVQRVCDALYMAQVTAQEIAADGILSATHSAGHRFNVLFVPGGLAAVHAKALGPAGRRAILEFVARGGGYFGICAGAYLGCTHRATTGAGEYDKGAANTKHAKSKAATAVAAKEPADEAKGKKGGAAKAADAKSSGKSKAGKSGSKTAAKGKARRKGDDSDDDSDGSADGADAAADAEASDEKALKFGKKVTLAADGSSTVHTAWAYGLVRAFLRDVEHWNRGVGDNCLVSYTPLGVAVMCAGCDLAQYTTKQQTLAASHDPKLAKIGKAKAKAKANASGATAGAETFTAADVANGSGSGSGSGTAKDGGVASGDDAPVITMRYPNGPLFDLCREHEARGGAATGGKAWNHKDWQYFADADDAQADTNADATATGAAADAKSAPSGALAQLGAVQVWARYETEFTKLTIPKGVMLGSPALIAAPYGSGRVVLCSPHPEKSDPTVTSAHLKNIFRWCAARPLPTATASATATAATTSTATATAHSG